MKDKYLPLTRRSFVGSSLGAAAMLHFPRLAGAMGFMAPGGACVLTAEQEVGPYYVADEMLRSEIAEGKPGVPLALHIQVLDATTCKPLPGAAVDIWHCDALGVYSGFTAQGGGGFGPGGPGGPPNGGPPPDGPPPNFGAGEPGSRTGSPRGPGPGFQNPPTDKLTFLRGIQLAGSHGVVNFRTVFPGFYMGRTNHIHLKVRVGGHPEGNTYAAGHTSHTGQIFFPETLSAELMQHEPYSAHKIHRLTQQEDFVFGQQHGDTVIANLTPLAPGKFTEGLRAEFAVLVDPAANPAPIAMGRPAARPPR